MLYLCMLLFFSVPIGGWLLLSRLKEIYHKKGSTIGRLRVFFTAVIVIQFLILLPYAMFGIIIAELSNVWVSLLLLILLLVSGFYVLSKR